MRLNSHALPINDESAADRDAEVEAKCAANNLRHTRQRTSRTDAKKATAVAKRPDRLDVLRNEAPGAQKTRLEPPIEEERPVEVRGKRLRHMYRHPSFSLSHVSLVRLQHTAMADVRTLQTDLCGPWRNPPRSLAGGCSNAFAQLSHF